MESYRFHMILPSNKPAAAEPLSAVSLVKQHPGLKTISSPLVQGIQITYHVGKANIPPIEMMIL